jgi:hypothetical protein
MHPYSLVLVVLLSDENENEPGPEEALTNQVP